ncbi:hypothetical protein T07_5629 [Trichinella nelsoni]|uniref:Uncharacterized protein n=1 Tax=Trichinella nelsoni TaxID=6336 RepID=A0A0V0RA49_9BILA|nr:hypothetical protein T07_5629 [Trichinella nelsoni]
MTIFSYFSKTYDSTLPDNFLDTKRENKSETVKNQLS